MGLLTSIQLKLTAKAFEELAGSSHSFLTSATDGVERSADCIFSSREIGR
jgi:hypothetical protein